MATATNPLEAYLTTTERDVSRSQEYPKQLPLRRQRWDRMKPYAEAVHTHLSAVKDEYLQYHTNEVRQKKGPNDWVDSVGKLRFKLDRLQDVLHWGTADKSVLYGRLQGIIEPLTADGLALLEKVAELRRGRGRRAVAPKFNEHAVRVAMIDLKNFGAAEVDKSLWSDPLPPF